jgi:hypothetical protein
MTRVALSQLLACEQQMDGLGIKHDRPEVWINSESWKKLQDVCEPMAHVKMPTPMEEERELPDAVVDKVITCLEEGVRHLSRIVQLLGFRTYRDGVRIEEQIRNNARVLAAQDRIVEAEVRRLMEIDNEWKALPTRIHQQCMQTGVEYYMREPLDDEASDSGRIASRFCSNSPDLLDIRAGLIALWCNGLVLGSETYHFFSNDELDSGKKTMMRLIQLPTARQYPGSKRRRCLAHCWRNSAHRTTCQPKVF